jgi:hypothetical protein
MEVSVLKTVGAVAGIGGLAFGVFFLLFRDFLRRFFESFPGVTRRQAFQLMRLFLILTWSIAVIGIIAFVVLEFKPTLATPPIVTSSPTPTPPPKPLMTSDFVVCMSEYERDCGPHNVYIYCYVDPAAEAAKACTKGYKLKFPPQSRGAAKCGANTYTYLCTNEAP